MAEQGWIRSVQVDGAVWLHAAAVAELLNDALRLMNSPVSVSLGETVPR